MTTNSVNPVFPITLYGKPNSMCFGCKKVKEKFNEAGIEYQFFDVTLPENAPLLEALQEQQIMSVPYIETPIGNWTGAVKDELDKAIAGYKAAVEAAA